MFEKSVMKSIVDQAEQAVKKGNASSVEEIVVEVGMLSNIDISSLEALWASTVKSSVLEGARKHVKQIPGRAKCTVCCKEFDMHDKFDACPECHDYLNEIVGGAEYGIRSIKMA